MQEMCHGMPILLEDRDRPGTDAKLFSLTGVQHAKVFIGTCREKTCKKTFFPHYSEDIKENIPIRRFNKVDDYFSFTKATVFTVKFMQFFSLLLNIAGAEFVNLIYCYNQIFCKNIEVKLDIRLLIDGFSTFHLAEKVRPTLDLLLFSLN